MLKLLFKTTFFYTAYSVLFSSVSLAQVIPDKTLGTESSTIRSVNDLRNAIEGGAIRGENLFHSFQEFSVNEGANASFTNPNGIANIFSRVTGGNISEIFGTLEVNGAANLFFMNPNGIVFGENATINIGGSFLATTAETINFDNNSNFSSIEANKPLLTIGFPIGLGFGSQSGIISVKDAGHAVVLEDAGFLPINRQSNDPGIQVVSGKNLALIGTEINLDGGILVSEGGRVELAGIKEGTVDLTTSPNNSAWNFEYSDVSSFGNVNLENTSWIDASATPLSILSPNINRGIKIVGEDILIKDESLVLIQNQIDAPDGKIEVNAANSFIISKVEIDPISEVPGGLISETLGSMPGADILVTSPVVSLVDGGTIFSKTFGPAKGGDIIIEASKSLLLSRASINDIPPIPSNISNLAYFDGKTGVTNINTPSLTIEDGATVTNIAVEGGNGDNITINATNVKLKGLESTTSIISSTISSSATGESQAADIFINTSTLEIEKGAAVVSNSFNLAKPGSINVNASDFVHLQGINSQISSAVSNPSENLIADLSSLQIDKAATPIGNSKDVNIQTDTIQIMDGAFVSVLNSGIGNGGSINIEASSVNLNNQANIKATTASGEGGNITLNNDNLRLQDQSQISSSAGGQGNGGNITIDSDTILGIENSDITANAVGGDGGNITINSDFVVGLEERSRLTRFSDITATSEFGIDGTVTINIPDSNLEEQVFAAFKNYTTPERPELLKRRCLNPRNRQQKIINIGRAGIPANPDNFFDDEEIIRIERVGESERIEDEPVDWIEGDPIVEPNAVKVGADGETYLVTETKVSQTPLKGADSGICHK